VSEAPAGGSTSANIGVGIGNGGNQGGIFAANAATTQAPFDTSVNYLTNVGSYTSATSYYGLYDVDGLVYNWTEATRLSFGNNLPIYRGGAWYFNATGVGAAYRNVYSGAGATSYSYFGFRVAGLPATPPPVITIDVTSGTQTQTQAGYATLSGTTPVFKTGVGTLVLDQANTLTGSMTVQGGVVRLANATALSASPLAVVAGGTAQMDPSLVASVAGLDLSGTGLVDLGSGGLAVAGGLSPTQLVAEIITGRNGGTWDGTSGITSSVAAAQVAAFEMRAVGWLDNGDGSLTVAYAAQGDTNLDWIVDVLDAANFATSGKYGTGDPATWAEGDFNYDGFVDVLDAADFAGTGLYGGAGYNSPAGVVAVPEPAATAVLVGLAIGAVGVRGSSRKRIGRS
jgi:autotransporter-associated beta strand protein